MEFLRWTFLAIAGSQATKGGYLVRFLEIFVRVDPGSDIFCEQVAFGYLMITVSLVLVKHRNGAREDKWDHWDVEKYRQLWDGCGGDLDVSYGPGGGHCEVSWFKK